MAAESETSKPENCLTCLRPNVIPGQEPTTQWLSFCRCDRPYTPNLQFSIDVCANCKRRTAKSSAKLPKSIGLCVCATPAPQKVPTSLKPGEKDAVELDLESIGLSSDNFPMEAYVPIAFLGDSARATTVLARDKRRGSKVAVKCFKRIKPALQTTFQNEAKKNQQLSHTNIAKVVDYGWVNDKAPYMVTDYKDGFNLKQCLKLYGVPSYDVAIKILLSTCEGLLYAQKQSVLHRDLRPENIIFLDDMNSEPSVSVTDFALPKVKAAEEPLNISDVMYLSADEARNLEFSEKSEVYTLGCVGYSLLTGQSPFQDESVQELRNKHALVLPPRTSSIKFDPKRPSELEEIVEKCLEKDPNVRYDSISKLMERLEVFPRREKAQIDAIVSAKNRAKLMRIALIAVVAVALCAGGYLVVGHH